MSASTTVDNFKNFFSTLNKKRLARIRSIDWLVHAILLLSFFLKCIAHYLQLMQEHSDRFYFFKVVHLVVKVHKVVKDKTFSQPHRKTPTPSTQCPLCHSLCHVPIHKHSTRKRHNSRDSLHGRIQAPTTHRLPTIPYSAHNTRFILKHSTFKFMDTDIHQILGTSMGTRMAPPYANLFIGKEECTIILTFLHIIYFCKRFIDDIFILLSSHSQLNSLMTFMNTISPTIKYTFTYSKQTVTFLDVKIYLSETRKLKTKLYRKPTDCMILLHFHSHHPLSCKEGIIYSQALRYNMIIPEDHILQAELNNLTRILLAHVYQLQLIIKNIKKTLTHSRNYLLSQRTPHTETNILPIITPFSGMGKQLIAIIHRNWHIVATTPLSTIWPSKPLSA